MLQHSEELKTPEEMFSPHVAQKLQRELSEQYNKFRRTQWCEAAELKDKARLDSASGKEAAAWVPALPQHFSSNVEPSTFRTTVSYPLGLPLPSTPHAPSPPSQTRSEGKK